MVISANACALLPVGDQSDLTGTSWRLVSYDGVIPIKGKDMTAVFDGEQISGSASCNHYFGAYKIKGAEITIEGLGWTEMACLDPEGIMEQEQAIMSLLSDAATFSFQGDRLEIYTFTGKSLIFVKLIETD
jgi:heat shock protein HslJ